MARVARASAWADAVFHVLAHVEVPLAASCFSAGYRAWAEERLGPASARPLEEDVRILLDLARASPAGFARAQALAWAFRSTETVRRAVEHPLPAAAVDDDTARAIAMSAGPLAEVLRAAAELEMPLLEALAPIPWSPAEVDAGLERVRPVAPALGAIALCPALGLRGRVHNARIFVGLPGIAGATVEHVAWQAAHEATVSEVSASDAGLPLSFLDLERRALGLLRSRARRAGLADAHARWLAHLDLREIGPIPDIDDAT